MNINRFLSALVVLITFPSALLAQGNDPVLMKIAGKEVKRSEFEYAFNKNNVNQIENGQTVEEYLPMFVDFKLKVTEALTQRLDTLPSFKSEYVKDRAALAESYLVDTKFIEEEAYRVYAQDSATIGKDGILKVSQIALPISQTASEESVASVKAKIDSAYIMLESGKSWEDVAQAIGVPLSSLSSVEIIRGQAYEEFENVAYALADGGYSKPFRSPVAYHIVKRISVRPFGSFEQYKKPIMQMLEQQNIYEVARLKKGTMLAEEFGGNLTPEQAIAKEDSLLETKYPEFGNLMREYYEGLLFFEISNREVWKSGEDLDAAHTKFFKKNKKKYKFDAPRFRGAVVFALSQEILDKVKTLLNGKNITEYRDIVKEHFLNDSVRLVRLELGVYAIGDNKWIDKFAFGQGEGGRKRADLPFVDVIGTIIETPEFYTDVKGAVADDYNKYKEEKWVKKLRKKYKVEIDKEVLKTVNNHD